MAKQKAIPVRIVHESSPSNMAYREPDRMHMSARQIKNGWLVSRSGYRDGKHFDEEMFTPNAPKFDIPSKPAARSVKSRGVTRHTKL
jgi:hypothetical protein